MNEQELKPGLYRDGGHTPWVKPNTTEHPELEGYVIGAVSGKIVKISEFKGTLVPCYGSEIMW